MACSYSIWFTARLDGRIQSCQTILERCEGCVRYRLVRVSAVLIVGNDVILTVVVTLFIYIRTIMKEKKETVKKVSINLFTKKYVTINNVIIKQYSIQKFYFWLDVCATSFHTSNVIIIKWTLFYEQVYCRCLIFFAPFPFRNKTEAIKELSYYMRFPYCSW